MRHMLTDRTIRLHIRIRKCFSSIHIDTDVISVMFKACIFGEMVIPRCMCMEMDLVTLAVAEEEFDNIVDSVNAEL